MHEHGSGENAGDPFARRHEDAFDGAVGDLHHKKRHQQRDQQRRTQRSAPYHGLVPHIGAQQRQHGPNQSD